MYSLLTFKPSVMKNTIFCWLAFLSALLLNMPASATKKQSLKDYLLKPDYINLQYAGNIGLGSVGLGYISNNEKHHLGFNYGYLPPFVNNVKVHTFTLKGAFQFKKHKLSEKASLNAYLGTHLLYSATSNTFVKWPSYYPDDYYFTNAIHLAPFLGVKINARKTINRFSYVEIGTLDYYLLKRIKYNRNRFSDCINLCMGFSIPLNNSPGN